MNYSAFEMFGTGLSFWLDEPLLLRAPFFNILAFSGIDALRSFHTSCGLLRRACSNTRVFLGFVAQGLVVVGKVVAFSRGWLSNQLTRFLLNKKSIKEISCEQNNYCVSCNYLKQFLNLKKTKTHDTSS